MPVTGAWRLTYSLYSFVDSGDNNWAYLHLNGDPLRETRHYTYSQTGAVTSTGGRVVTLEASAGDQIEIRATTMGNNYYQTRPGVQQCQAQGQVFCP